MSTPTITETLVDKILELRYESNTTLIALLDGEVGVDSFTDEHRFALDVVELLPNVVEIMDIARCDRLE